METLSALLAICAGNSPVPGEFPAQRPVTRSFDVFFDPRPNQRLSKQWRGWWFETPSCPLWRHCNVKKTWGAGSNTDLSPSLEHSDWPALKWWWDIRRHNGDPHLGPVDIWGRYYKGWNHITIHCCELLNKLRFRLAILLDAANIIKNDMREVQHFCFFIPLCMLNKHLKLKWKYIQILTVYSAICLWKFRLQCLVHFVQSQLVNTEGTPTNKQLISSAGTQNSHAITYMHVNRKAQSLDYFGSCI